MARSSSFSLYKSASFALAIDALFYAASVLTLVFCSFRFFFAQKFFVEGIGSTDLRSLFQSVPYVSIVTVPLLVFRLRSFVFDDSLPVSPTARFCSVSLSAFSAFALPVLALSAVPAFVYNFGDVDGGQVFAGFVGVLLYGLCAVSFVALLFSAFPESSAVPLLLSMLSLAMVDFVHLVPLYLKVGPVLTFLLQKISFAWHFDSFGKGIVDSRDIAFYILASLLFVLLSVLSEYKRTGRKVSRLTFFLFVVVAVFSSLSFDRIYFRADLTKARQFSASDTSRSLLENLDSTLRITYYRSRELKDLYPQSSDVAEYLQDFARLSSNVTFELESADAEKLSRLKIQGRQIQVNSKTKMEFVSVYSAVVLQYLDKQTIIPFILSTETLEYDLAQRIQQLVTENPRRVLVLAGNGRAVQESYGDVVPFLASRGFMPEILEIDDSLVSKIDSLSADDELVVLGTSALSYEQSSALDSAFKRGVPALVATSPYDVPIENEWKVSKNTGDTMLPFLNSLGFAFGRSLVEDISCFPLSMMSGEGETAEYVSINYPLWVSLLPQDAAKQGMTLFWPSPIFLYNDVRPLLETTDYAWLQKESDSDELPFLTDAFNIPKTAAASDAENGKYILAATNGKVTVVSDQYFVHSMMTGFISGQNSVDLRNFDFLCSQLLRLRGDSKIAELMEKARTVKSLYKISDSSEFVSEMTRTIAVNFVLLPLIFVAVFVFVFIKRNRKVKNEK
nr:Gldg family protein [Treponema sp.]